MALTTAEAKRLVSPQCGFTEAQSRFLNQLIDDLYTRIATAEGELDTLIDTNGLDGLQVGDLSAADASDTLVSDANGVFQLNPV